MARSTFQFSEPSKPRNPRDRVAARLVRRARRFPDLPLDPLDVGDLDARDASLAHAIDHAVARRWLTLVAIIQSRLDRPWERVQPELQAILLAATAQLFFLDRLPDHAVVDHAVEWTKTHVRPKAAGFINAILRAIVALRGPRDPSIPVPHSAQLGSMDLGRHDVPLADGRIITLADPVFADDSLARLSQQTSHGSGLITHWSNSLGVANTRKLSFHDVVDPPIIVAGHDPAVSGAKFSPHAEPGFAVFEGAHAELLDLLARNPYLRVQDPTSARPVNATRNLKPKLIADLCAGHGTKTIQLASLHSDARIIASDPDQDRMMSLRRRFEGSDRVLVVERSAWLDFANSIELLVLDVPCSNTGVLARRVEAKYRFNEQQVGELVSLQRQILADSLALRAPGGRILYATCSIDRRENQEQAQWLAKWHGVKVEAEELTMPSGLPGEPPASYHDGGYWALLR